MAAIKEMYFDIYKQPSLTPIIYGRVGDGGTQTVKIYLTEDNEVINLKNFTITFEGNTSGNKTVIMDTDGVSNINYTEGSFSYTFPNMTFGVSGEYERAYFSITNTETKERSTTADFKIIVFDNADITAEEGITVITEYNKLVEELHKLQAKNIADLEDELKDIKTDIVSLQSSMASYKTSVEKTATDAKNSINATSTAAIKTINDSLAATQTKITAAEKELADALEKFNNADFYTKKEIDSKLSTIEVTKEKVGLGNVDNFKTATDNSASLGTSKTEFITPYGVTKRLESNVASKDEAIAGSNSTKSITPSTLDAKFNDKIGVFDLITFNGEDGGLTGTGLNGKEAGVGTQVISMSSNTLAERASNGRAKMLVAGTYLIIIHTWFQIGATTDGYFYWNLMKNGSRAGNYDRIAGLGSTTVKNRWDITGQSILTLAAGDEVSISAETNITGGFSSAGCKVMTLVKLA